MKKQVLAGALAASIAAVAIAGASLAYFTDEKVKDNTFNVGNVAIELTEPSWNNGTDLGGFEVEAKDLYPGEAVAKDPTVKNVGANPAFVRIKVDMAENVKNVISFRTDYQDGISSDWEEYNGYYYYKGVLAVNETTDALFDQIVLSTSVENDQLVGTQNINVTAQAVQAQGAQTKWADVENMTVGQIAAWFATCGLDA